MPTFLRDDICLKQIFFFMCPVSQCGLYLHDPDIELWRSCHGSLTVDGTVDSQLKGPRFEFTGHRS